MSIFKKYHCIKQHDIKDCGAACLATISKQYGLKTPISKIREVAGTDNNGTSAYGVVKAAVLQKELRHQSQKIYFQNFPNLL